MLKSYYMKIMVTNEMPVLTCSRTTRAIQEESCIGCFSHKVLLASAQIL